MLYIIFLLLLIDIFCIGMVFKKTKDLNFLLTFAIEFAIMFLIFYSLDNLSLIKSLAWSLGFVPFVVIASLLWFKHNNNNKKSD